jgi:outer membrane protein W
MKKVLISIGLITNFLNHNTAQINKGSWLIGGDLSITQAAVKAYGAQSNISRASAETGYFFTDQFMAGSSISAVFENRINPFSGWGWFHNEQTFALTPYARYYLNPKSKLKCFTELSLGGFWNRSTSGSREWSNEFGTKIGTKLGANYFLTNNIAFEGDFRYEWTTSNKYVPQRFKQLAFHPHLGMRLFLNTPKQEADILGEKYLKKGNMTVGVAGDLRLSDYSYGNLLVHIGYFLTDKWLFMMNLAVNSDADGYGYWAVAPEMRYYKPISNTMQYFLRGNVQLAHYTSDYARQWGGESVELGMGLNQFVSKNISVEATANLRATGTEMSIAPIVRVGFQYFMNR